MSGRIGVWLLAAAIGAGCAARPVPRFAGGVEVPLTVTRLGTLLVPVAIGGGAARPFVLDTAASITALTPAAADELGVVAGDRTVTVYDSRGTNPEAMIATVPLLAVGGLAHRDQRVAVVALPAGNDLDVQFAGVLGLDVLRTHDVVIDLSRNVLDLHPSGALAGSAAAADMDRTALYRGRDGLLRLQVRLDDRASVDAILDLGSQITVLNSAAAALLASAPYIDTATNTIGITLPRRFGTDLRRVREIRVGTLGLPYQLVVVADLPAFERFGFADRPAIILGANLFAGRAVAIAFADRAMYLSR